MNSRWTGLLLCGLMLGCGSPEPKTGEPSIEKTASSQMADDSQAKQTAETSSLPPAPEPEKPMAANSFINKPAPKFVVQEWLSPKVPSLEGKMVLVDFWTTWCRPCREGIPKLNQFHRKYKDRLVVVGLSDEEADQVRAFDKVRIDYPVAIDPQYRMAGELGVQGFPHIIIIDPTGIVRWEGLPSYPGHELTEEVIESLLDTYVSKTADAGM